MRTLNHFSGKKILVAPLDWGLGHATRCIPVIRELEHLGCVIFIGSEGQQAALLKKEFPTLVHLNLPGYRMAYSNKGKNFGFKMLAQLPKMRKAIHQEHQWLKEAVRKWQLDAVISDNRFGLYHPDVPSVVMTHQLHIVSPFPGKPEAWLQKINYRLLSHFDSCWIVDFKGEENLGGQLSHPAVWPSLPVKFLGPLSRFEKTNKPGEELDLLALISGPEPQRTHFETLISQQIKQLPLKALVVCGQPDIPRKEKPAPNIDLVHHLDSGELEDKMNGAKMILSRSGYTTVMDLVKLQKKAILIPTPGQTEQEYLARYLQEKGYFLSFSQAGFQLQNALKAAVEFPFKKPVFPEMDRYKEMLGAFIKEL